MTATSHEPSTVDRATGDDGLWHIASDHDDDWSLCGRDISGHAWAESPAEGESACVVCVELDAVLP